MTEEKTKNKIGVIGDRESVVGFKAVGFDAFICNDSEEASELIRTMSEDYAIIYIMEDLAAKVTDEIDRYKDLQTPAIIPIPGKNGASGSGMRNVKEAVKRAVGADILFGGNE